MIDSRVLILLHGALYGLIGLCANKVFFTLSIKQLIGIQFNETFNRP